jgi:pimeloyl-ACP methyl ester carboxylesterase
MNAASPRRRILYVPGKNPKPAPERHAVVIKQALVHGVGRSDPDAARAIEADAGAFRLIAWNRLYYGAERPIEPDLPWIDELLRRSGPTTGEVREALSFRRKFATFLYNVADVFPSSLALLPDAVVRSTVEETRRYFDDAERIGTRVREILKQPLREMTAAGDRVLLIGHSMGSVIAFDALWELTHLEAAPAKVELFLTIGSPLGMHFVQARLLGHDRQGAERYPHGVRAWINVAAQGDLTAIDPMLHDDFAPMRRLGLVESITDLNGGVFNYFRNEEGLNVHRSYGYLVNPRVGEVIARWWRQA